jgi:hypothetical protein
MSATDKDQATAVPTAAPTAGAGEASTEKGSLYVGDLDKDVQETHLFDLFSEVCRPSCRSMVVCRADVRQG